MESAWLSLVWLALSLALGGVAAHSAVVWAERAPINTLAVRARRLLGIGIGLGTGWWSVQALGGATAPGAWAGGPDAGVEFALWAAAGAAGAAALGGPDTRSGRLAPRLLAGFGLSICTVALQALALHLHAPDTHDLAWSIAALAGAWAASLAGCGTAMLLCHVSVAWRRDRRAQARVGAGMLLGGAVLSSQRLVLHAAQLPLAEDPSANVLVALLVLLISGGVLFGSYLLLVNRLRDHAAHATARRKRDAQGLNDPLTGLPTRQLFEGALAQAAKRADSNRQRLALLLINLDGFKPINQGFGHLGGDKVLREVAARVRALAPAHMAARLGGDEFLVLLNGDPQMPEASALAARLIAAIAAPFTIDGRAANLSCSIGIAMYPEHGAKSTMIAHAQAAMNAAKTAGGAGHAFFERRMIQGMRDDAELLRDLRGALERKQLELYYQPKIHAPTGEITGAEALMRWQHPTRGMLGPVVFIPLAERYGLIDAMGRWVIDEACRQARVWRDDGLRMRVAINLSVHQLRQPDLADWIAASLQRHQINPDLITCEVTESSAMDDTEVTMRVLGQLDQIGVHISIDDFGTGHSSLAYLRKLPADELKIDRSFVLDLESNEDARKVAVAVINLAKALSLKVVAEGVETEAQNRILREFGCDQLQGYLFAKPMSAKALGLWAIEDVGPRTMNFRDSLFKETRPAAVA